MMPKYFFFTEKILNWTGIRKNKLMLSKLSRGQSRYWKDLKHLHNRENIKSKVKADFT